MRMWKQLVLFVSHLVLNSCKPVNFVELYILYNLYIDVENK